MENIADIYENLSRCEQKVALVEKAETIKLIKSRLNVRGKSKTFWSGNPNHLQIEQPIFWGFDVPSGMKDIHLTRLKSLVESGLYNYVKSLMNPVNATVLAQLDALVKNKDNHENIGIRPLSLDSKIVSIFFFYSVCVVGVSIFWLAQKFGAFVIDYLLQRIVQSVLSHFS